MNAAELEEGANEDYLLVGENTAFKRVKLNTKNIVNALSFFFNVLITYG